MNKLMIGVSGIRGVFKESLTPEIVMNFASHYGIFCNRGTIVIARDSRKTGNTLKHAVISGLMSVGCRVVDIGITATPTLLLTVKDLKADGGICLTASHNPAQWNALKLCDSNGMFLFPEKADKFISSLQNKVDYADWDQQGTYGEYINATFNHIRKVLSIPYIDIEKIRKRRFKVVVDSVNGAGGLISPFLLSELGCEVIGINTEPTGLFAHNPEPLNHNLEQLKQAVKEHHADIGFATDPDVDRLALVSEQGVAIGEELSLLLSSDFVLSVNQGDIVTNLSSSMAIDDIAAKYGVQVHRTKVGEINVGKLMKEINSPIGGEGNGGIICPWINYTRDAVAGMALILGYLAKSGKTLSQLAETIPVYFITKDRITSAGIDEIVSQADTYYDINTIKQDEDTITHIDRTDGIKIIGNGYWIHLRKSGTEPIIRIYVESDSQERSDRLCKKTKDKLLSFFR